MSQLFTVRWPLFARLEAASLFPVACSAAGQFTPLRTFINQTLVMPLVPLLFHLGISNLTIFWAGMAIAVIVPYVVLLVVIDRFLTVRKGFAWLSMMAIGIWTAVAWRAPALVAEYVPEPYLHDIHWLSAAQKAALTMGSLTLVLHLMALWIGLRDRGEVADRLLAERDAYPYRARNGSAVQDVYHRQNDEFRGWQLQKGVAGHGSGPREDTAVQFLYGVTWSGLIAVAAVAYLIWYGYPGFGPGIRYRDPPVVDAGSVRAPVATTAPAPVIVAPPHPAPVAPPPAEHMAVAAPPPPPPPMPNVQRPTAVSNSLDAGGTLSGANEAVSRRGTDGSFAFDAVVNGGHVRMLFDTGATVVGLRAEDAERLGIDVDNLTYSAKIKTANGTAEVAPIMIETMMIGNITLRKVPGFVARQGALPQNLLGQTFLTRLAGFNVESNLLILRGR